MIRLNNSFVVLLALWVLSLLAASSAVRASAVSDVGPVAGAVNEFSLDLYGKLKKSGRNLFVSPYSASVALSMAYAGARGKTETEMARVLRFTMGQDQVHSAMSTLHREIVRSGNSDGMNLNIANALWGQKGYDFGEQFLDVLKDQYGSRFREVDFKGSPGQAIAAINRWADVETKGRIKDIIDNLPPDTRLILANAIYFKGIWKSKYEKSRTKKEDFFLPDNKKTLIPLMRQTMKVRYFQDTDFQLIELPYEQGQFSMFVLLPWRNVGLDKLEESVTAERLSHWMKQRKSRMVEVYLPRWKMTDRLLLKPSLSSLGMTDAFSMKRADFSGMTPNAKRDLFIGQVIQKSFVDVKEEGTEAAAVTTMGMPTARALYPRKKRPPIPVFRADHPFMFFIQHNPTNCILFVGRLAKPDSE